MKLYITYTHEDLADYAKAVSRVALDLRWEVIDGPNMVFAPNRLASLADCQALVVLSARL